MIFDTIIISHRNTHWHDSLTQAIVDGMQVASSNGG
jgi:hypothetical protein